MFLELAISGSIESVEAGRSSGDVLFDFVGFGEDAELVDLFAEVAFVERLFEDEFVEVLELGKGEFFGKKFEADGLIADFSAKAFARHLENVGMVKGEGREVVEREPGGVSSIGGGGRRVLDEIDESVIGDGDNVLAGIAVRSADSGELFEENVFESGFLFELPAGAVIDVFADPNESSGESPFIFEGRKGALNEEDFQVILIESKDDAICGEGGSRVLVGEAHELLISVIYTLCNHKV